MKIKNQNIVIFIVGASGSGKDTFADILQKQHGVKKVISYTTRPLRSGEAEGENHYHIPLSEFVKPDNMFAYTLFDNKHHYWTLEEQILRGSRVKSYIVDEPGVIFAKNTLRKFKYRKITPIFVKIDVSASTARARGVSEDRIARDDSRKPLPDDTYDYIITNNDSGIDSLYRKANELITKINNTNE